MRWFSTPKTLALLSGLALAWNAGTPLAEAQSAEQAKAVSVVSVTTTAVRDRYNQQNQWMQVDVELNARTNPDAQAVNPKWIKDVTVSLTLGWGTGGAAPVLDLAVAATAHLVAMQVNQQTSVLFYLSPEFLQSGSKNPSGINASMKPTFYVVEITAAGLPMAMTQYSVSAQTLPDRKFVDGFLGKAADDVKKNQGMMLTTNDVPFYVLAEGVGGGSNMVIPMLKANVPGM